jgi:hypothetical protein
VIHVWVLHFAVGEVGVEIERKVRSPKGAQYDVAIGAAKSPSRTFDGTELVELAAWIAECAGSSTGSPGERLANSCAILSMVRMCFG